MTTTSGTPTPKAKAPKTPKSPPIILHKILCLSGTQAEIEAQLNSLGRYGWEVVTATISLGSFTVNSPIFTLIGIATKSEG